MAAQIAVDRRWAASIVALSRLPPEGADVWYFPRGHAEQWLAGPAAPQGHGVRCIVQGINYFTDGEEPCGRITLLPLAADDGDNNPPAADDHNPPPPGRFLFFSKTIPNADKQRSYMGIPKLCVPIFQPFQAGEKEQQLVMQDVSGRSWDMLHKEEGTRHSLKKQWREFVEVKRADVGDIVVFFSCPPDGKILAEVRRARAHNIAWGVEEVAEASQQIIQGNSFTVTYYPGRGNEPFIVPRAVVDAAAGTEWTFGMSVRLRPKDEVVHLQERGSAAGVVRRGAIVEVIPGAGAGPTWRHLQVDWDDAPVNMWEIEPDTKRSKLSDAVAPVASTAKGINFGNTLVPQGSGST